MKKNIKILKLCPHWFDENGLQECNIAKGGLFIPMPQHIETFCISEQFHECTQYIRAYERQREQAQRATDASGDRRMNRRIGWDYSLYFSPLEEMGLQKESERKEAKSVDISLGGMRIKSCEDISHQQVMAFSFVTDQEEANSIDGIGELQWCRETPDQEYLAGVSFVFLHEGVKDKLHNRF